jgi:cell division protein FtsB
MTTLKKTDSIAEIAALTDQLVAANIKIAKLTSENEDLKARLQELEKTKKPHTPDMKNVFRR